MRRGSSTSTSSALPDTACPPERTAAQHDGTCRSHRATNQTLRRPRGGPRPGVDRRTGRDLRLPRSERCREDDHAADGARHPQTDGRSHLSLGAAARGRPTGGEAARRRGGRARLHPRPPHSRRVPAVLRRPLRSPASRRAHWDTAGTAGPARVSDAAGPRFLARHETEAGTGQKPAARTRSAAPRRAGLRTRPAWRRGGAPSAVGAEPPWGDDLHLVASPLRGRADGAPGRDHAPGPADPARHDSGAARVAPPGAGAGGGTARSGAAPGGTAAGAAGGARGAGQWPARGRDRNAGRRSPRIHFTGGGGCGRGHRGHAGARTDPRRGVSHADGRGGGPMDVVAGVRGDTRARAMWRTAGRPAAAMIRLELLSTLTALAPYLVVAVAAALAGRVRPAIFAVLELTLGAVGVQVAREVLVRLPAPEFHVNPVYLLRWVAFAVSSVTQWLLPFGYVDRELTVMLRGDLPGALGAAAAGSVYAVLVLVLAAAALQRTGIRR